ncbi:MAG TPA: hypothetical protein VHC49_26650, partial [Mycobacteriales bacterium]|nr:hypothetical protein [Mycobacteriales bacterium]
MADLLGGGRDRPPRRWIGMAAAVVLLAGAGLYGALHDSSNSPEPAPIPTDGAPPTISQRALHKPILGITGKWELFGRGADSVVRVQLAKGLITRTAVPLLSSSGGVSFL